MKLTRELLSTMTDMQELPRLLQKTRGGLQIYSAKNISQFFCACTLSQSVLAMVVSSHCRSRDRRLLQFWNVKEASLVSLMERFVILGQLKRTARA